MNGVDRSAQRSHAAAEWAALRERLQTVTPQALGRAAIAFIAVGGAAWLAAASWPAFLPFVVGGLIAYQLLPVVDGLDRVMPRPLAALIAVLAAVAVVVGIAVIVLPPMAGAFVRFAADLPSKADIDAAIANLQAQIGTLPEGSLAVILPVVTTLAATIQDVFSGAGNGLDDIIRAGLGALLNAVGALLGLIVLPTWMLSVMSQKHRARIAIDNQITPSLRKDLWAVAAIFDRGAGAYLRGYIVTAFLVGLLTYLGAVLSPRIGGPQFGEPLALATFAGATQVIPIVGPLLGLLPAALILPIDAERAVVYLAIYLIAKYAGASLLGSRVMGRRLGVHPAILVPAVVMLGQFGVLALLLSAPIISISADLIRYFHGRLSEPPRPAGELPRSATSSVTTATTALTPVPSAYRPATAPPPIVLSGSQPAAPTS
jgi:predicted PurR-regulated permease PerM